MSEPDLAEIWARSLNDLADMQIEPYQRAWLQLTRPLGLVENTALIATPNEFAKDQLENRLRALITNALSRELGRSIQLAVIIDPAVTAALPAPDESQSAPDPLGIRMPFGAVTDRSPGIPSALSHLDGQGGTGGDAGQHDGAVGVDGHPGRNGQQAGFGMNHGPLPLQPGPAGLPHLPGHRADHETNGSDGSRGSGLGHGIGSHGIGGHGIGSGSHGIGSGLAPHRQDQENGHRGDGRGGLSPSGGPPGSSLPGTRAACRATAQRGRRRPGSTRSTPSRPS